LPDERDPLASDLAALDPAAVLVTPRVLRRVIKRHARVAAFGDVPHDACYVIDRSALASICDAADLGRAPRDLPETVLLVARPEGDAAVARARAVRALFHAEVHRTLDARALTPAALRARIHRIGETEFDEIRFVLRHDDRLLPPYDDASTYAEFAATYLELASFAPDLVERTFPAISDREVVRATLAEDVDGAAIVARLCPEGAPTPAPHATGAHEDEEDEPALSRRSLLGVARTSSSGAAPARDIVSTMFDGDARAAARELGARVAAMLGHAGGERAWSRAIEEIAIAANARTAPRWSVESRLLHDLQKACVAFERDTLAVDVLAWAATLGRTPLVRALPAQRDVRALKHMRSAAARALAVHIGDPRRTEIARLAREGVARAEANLRRTMRPEIRGALESVGLVPVNVPERVAADKLALELIDAVVDRGYLSLGALRDAVSRNNLKLPNLAGPGELVRGDAILRADARLAHALDGVYRRGEIYLRLLQRGSALTFGTSVGRFLTRFFLLPVGVAYVGLEGAQHIVGPLCEHVLHIEEPHLFTPVTFAVGSALVFGLLHSAHVRAAVLGLLRAVGFVLKSILVTAPSFVWNLPPVQAIARSRPMRMLRRYVVKPAFLTAIALGAAHLAHARLDRTTIAIAFAVGLVVWNALLNTRAGTRFEEAVADAAARQWRELHRRVLPGLFALIGNVFRALTERFERAIYAVDAYLLFHRGDGKLSIALRGALGVVWFFAAYLGRIYVNLLIEPQVNPIKHFPVVTVAAKIMLPMAPTIIRGMRRALTPIFGHGTARVLGTVNTFLLPGFFGFLVWELKENWKLYRANRRGALSPVAIGHHGESMAGLLKIGFHSGTIPKTYAKLRRAAWKDDRRALKHRHALHHVEDAVRLFVERELLLLLEASARFSRRIDVGRVDIASNRVRVELACDGQESALVAFEEQSGWIVAGVARAGFIDALTDDERVVFENALAGLYKLAAVDLVREQIAASLPEGAPYDVSDRGVVAWADGDYDRETVIALDAKNIPMYRDFEIPWVAWTRAWDDGAPLRGLVTGPSLLPARSQGER
jgi:hypothetical protein